MRGTGQEEGEGVSGKRQRRGMWADPEGEAGWGRTELAPEALAVCAFEVSRLEWAGLPNWAKQSRRPRDEATKKLLFFPPRRQTVVTI